MFCIFFNICYGEDRVNFGNYLLVVCCMKGIFELKLVLFKYIEMLNVNILVDILLGYVRVVVFLRFLFFK